jgi:hypothetical protein
MRPFRPAATVSLSGSTSTSRVQITGTTGVGCYRLYNAGTVVVFIKEGDGTVNAAVTDTPIAPGAIEVLSFANQYIAGITASGTATIYITAGDGI